MIKSKKIVQWHIILGAICSLPLLLTAITGVFLILRQHLSFMQPPEIRRPAIMINKLISPEKIIDVSGINPSLVNTIIYKPKSGIIQVRTNDQLEYHFSALDGSVLQFGPKRTSLFIQLHEGSYFGELVKNFVFIPMAFIFILVLFSGIYLTFFWLLRKIRVSKIRNFAADQEILINE